MRAEDTGRHHHHHHHLLRQYSESVSLFTHLVVCVFRLLHIFKLIYFISNPTEKNP